MGHDTATSASAAATRDFGGRAARRSEVEIKEGRLRIGEGEKGSETGLEGIFSEGFRIRDGPVGREEVGVEGSRDMGGGGNGRRSNVFGFWATAAVLAFVAVILAGANAVLPGFYGGISRGLASIWRS